MSFSKESKASTSSNILVDEAIMIDSDFCPLPIPI